MKGHKTHQTLTLLINYIHVHVSHITCLGRYMLERYKTFNPKPKHMEELKNMECQRIWNVFQVYTGPIASCLNQQGHSELHKKNSSLFESMGWTLRTYFSINLKEYFNF